MDSEDESPPDAADRLSSLDFLGFDPQRFAVHGDARVSIADFETDAAHLFPEGKAVAKSRTKSLNDRAESLQELLYAEYKRRVLIVLQGMDTAGKDGVIRHVFDGMNPQGVKVAKFGVPTREELDHDFLWRVHPHVPGSGFITIFNRSHYEDVLVVRVRDLAPPEVWEPRYEQINDFERLLAESGTTILKFYLHISKAEQKERLQARLDDPEKQWKFKLGDLEERELWDDYMQAYEAMLHRTSTAYAPWYVVPSDRKWLRNLIVGSIIIDTLESFAMEYPEPDLPVPPAEIEIDGPVPADR